MPQRLFSAMGYGKFRPIIDVEQLKSKEKNIMKKQEFDLELTNKIQ